MGARGLEVDGIKVDAIKKKERPKDGTTLPSFLGAVGYYRRFFSGSADIAGSHFKLTKNGAEFNWTNHTEVSYMELV